MTADQTGEGALRQTTLGDVALRLSKALDGERRRIAEGLHDDVGQTLAAANIRLHEVRLATTDADRDTAAAEVEKLIHQAIESTRGLTFDLMVPVLPGEGFPGILEDLAARFSDENGISCCLDVGDGPVWIGSAAADIVYRVVRELLHNISKHACATTANIHVTSHSSGLDISVSDDGVGFDVDMPPDGLGLLIVKERIAEVGGRMTISSGSSGTNVTMSLPSSVDERVS